jgi:acetyl esterase/lipase
MELAIAFAILTIVGLFLLPFLVPYFRMYYVVLFAIKMGAFYERFRPSGDKKLSREARALLRILQKSVIPRTPSVKEFREQLGSLVNITSIPLNTKRYYRLIMEKMNHSCYVIDRAVKQNSQKSVILYIHGGGFIAGTPDSGIMAYKVISDSKRTCVDYFGVNYALLPEETIEQALTDIQQCYKFLIEQCYHSITIMADDIGCNLALLALLDKIEDKSKLYSIILFSPWIDLTMSTNSFKNFGKIDLLFSNHIMTCIEQYSKLSQQDKEKYSVYKRMKELKSKLPRVFLSYSTSERVADENEQFWEVIKNDKSRVHTKHGLMHIYQLFVPLIPEAVEVVKEAAQFVE